MLLSHLTINRLRRWSFFLSVPVAIAGSLILPWEFKDAQAQTGGRAITIRSDLQEANSTTGVITARGNVQINYPARQMQATAAQAQYFDNERIIVLTGNVYILQQGNSLRGEKVTYLVDEGRMVAEPRNSRQVESIYIISDPEAPAEPQAAPQLPPYNPKPAFKAPESTP